LQRFSFTTGSRLFAQLETLEMATHQVSISKVQTPFLDTLPGRWRPDKR
jgi:hypothetical protein